MERPGDRNERETQSAGSGGRQPQADSNSTHIALPQCGSPRAHLDLLLQVFSPSHEILNLPREDMPGTWGEERPSS